MSDVKHDCHCGAGWMPKWFKRILSKKFNECCATHDKGYQDQNAPKEFIDDNFLTMMIERSDGWIDLFFAYAFYFFVIFFGWLSWHHNKFKSRFRKGQ